MKASEIMVEVERGLRMFKAFENAHKIIEGLQNAEQVERETLARVEPIKAEVANWVAKIAEAKAEAESVSAHSKKIIDDATASAATILSNAKQECKAVMDEAKAYVETAANSRDRLLAELTAIKEQINSANMEHADIEQRISQAKEQIKKLLVA